MQRLSCEYVSFWDALSYASDTAHFNENISSLLELLENKSQLIARAQLEALGAKSRVESEVERRKASQAQLRALVSERQMELNRYTFNCL